MTEPFRSPSGHAAPASSAGPLRGAAPDFPAGPFGGAAPASPTGPFGSAAPDFPTGPFGSDGRDAASGEPAAAILAGWAAGLRFADLPGAVVEAARRHLIDALGCAVAGIRHGAAGPALTVATGLGGPPEARLFGGERIGAVAAAFGNAVAVHALDFDDTHPAGLVHASAVTVPVAYIYANIETVLAAGGVSGSAVTSLIEYVTPVAVADHPRTRALREKHFPNAAVTAVVCSALLRPEFLLETIPGVVPA